MFASGWQEWNLFGWKAGLVTLSCLLLATVTSNHKLFQEKTKMFIVAVMPAALLLGFWAIDLMRRFKVYEAQLDTARVVCLAFAFAFAVDSIRKPSPTTKIVGMCSLALVGYAAYNYASGFLTRWGYYAN